MPSDIASVFLGGLIAGSVNAIGWFVTDAQRRGEDRRTRYIDFLQKQIIELYAPLSILADREHSYSELQKDLKNRGKSEVADFFTHAFVVPIRKEICGLIQNKAYLLGKNKSLPIFQEVLDHYNRALALYELVDKARSGDLSEIPAGSMPDHFKDEVCQILNGLQEEYDRQLTIRLKKRRLSQNHEHAPF